MGASRKKNPNAGTPFEEIEKDFDTSISIQDLHSKVLTFDVERNTNRELVNGLAYLCDLKTKIIARATVRNLSPDGVRFEIPPLNLHSKEDIFVDFSGSLNLGMVLCTIQWISEIEGHKNHHRLMGLKFKGLSKLKKKRLLEYIAQLRSSRQKDPFFL